MSAGRMREFGAAVELHMVDALRSCGHRQAEPVTLSTGERVACVCIACLGALSADWIQRQCDKAHREAYCTHDDEVEITSLGQVEGDYTCTSCGRWRRG